MRDERFRKKIMKRKCGVSFQIDLLSKKAASPVAQPLHAILFTSPRITEIPLIGNRLASDRVELFPVPGLHRSRRRDRPLRLPRCCILQLCLLFRLGGPG